MLFLYVKVIWKVHTLMTKLSFCILTALIKPRPSRLYKQNNIFRWNSSYSLLNIIVSSVFFYQKLTTFKRRNCCCLWSKNVKLTKSEDVWKILIQLMLLEQQVVFATATDTRPLFSTVVEKLSSMAGRLGNKSISVQIYIFEKELSKLQSGEQFVLREDVWRAIQTIQKASSVDKLSELWSGKSHQERVSWPKTFQRPIRAICVHVYFFFLFLFLDVFKFIFSSK